jgi:hypothetical protein
VVLPIEDTQEKDEVQQRMPLKITVTPSSLVGVHPIFERTCYLQLQASLLPRTLKRNILSDRLQPNYNKENKVTVTLKTYILEVLSLNLDWGIGDFVFFFPLPPSLQETAGTTSQFFSMHYLSIILLFHTLCITGIDHVVLQRTNYTL